MFLVYGLYYESEVLQIFVINCYLREKQLFMQARLSTVNLFTHNIREGRRYFQRYLCPFLSEVMFLIVYVCVSAAGS